MPNQLSKLIKSLMVRGERNPKAVKEAEEALEAAYRDVTHSIPPTPPVVPPAPPIIPPSVGESLGSITPPPVGGGMSKLSKGALGLGALGLGSQLLTDEEPVPSVVPERKPASEESPQDTMKKIAEKLKIPAKKKPAIGKAKPAEIDQSAAKLIEDAKSQQPSTDDELDVGQASYDPIAELGQAQDRRNQQQILSQLGLISERGAAAIGGFKPQYGDVYENINKQAGQHVEDLKERIAQDKNDPNSPVSQAFKKFMEKFGVKPKGDFTAAIGEQVLPMAYKTFEAQESRKSRKDIADESNTMRKFLAQENAKNREAGSKIKVEEKQDQMDVKRLDDLGKKLTSETASSRSAFGKAANNIRSAEAIEALGQQFKDKGQLDKRQVYELARSLDTLLSQGAGTMTGTAHLIPSTATGDISKIAEYIGNIPVGARQGEFVKRTLETVAREKDLAKEQIKRTQGKILGSYKETLKRHPERARDILEPHGLDFLLDESGEEEKQAPKSNKVVIKKGYNAAKNQTQLIYSDGTKEIVDGKR